MREVTLYVTQDGTVTFVHDDAVMAALGPVGRSVTRRASHVEPEPVSRDGPTRWLADMSPVIGQPVILGPFASRQEALQAESAWLDHLLQYGKPPQLILGEECPCS